MGGFPNQGLVVFELLYQRSELLDAVESHPPRAAVPHAAGAAVRLDLAVYEADALGQLAAVLREDHELDGIVVRHAGTLPAIGDAWRAWL